MGNISTALTKLIRIRNFAINILVFAGIFMIPTLSHVTPFPLYILDPMRLFMLFGYFLSRNNINGYFLSLTIPLFSFFVSGHPVFFKAVLISLELLFNLLVFIKLVKATNHNIAISMFISIIASKLFYYCLKFFFRSVGLIEGSLFGISIWVQLSTITFITLIFSILSNKIKRDFYL